VIGRFASDRAALRPCRQRERALRTRPRAMRDGEEPRTSPCRATSDASRPRLGEQEVASKGDLCSLGWIVAVTWSSATSVAEHDDSSRALVVAASFEAVPDDDDGSLLVVVRFDSGAHRLVVEVTGSVPTMSAASRAHRRVRARRHEERSPTWTSGRARPSATVEAGIDLGGTRAVGSMWNPACLTQARRRECRFVQARAHSRVMACHEAAAVLCPPSVYALLRA
jgi:hypothetical protein